MRAGKASPELEQHLSVKQQVRQSVLNRQQQHRPSPGDCLKSLDPMLAMAELSQIQVKEGLKEVH